jgi:polysaccharide biosynthesis protein PelF
LAKPIGDPAELASGARGRLAVSGPSIADNVVGITDVILDVCPAGRKPAARDEQRVGHAVRLMQSTLGGDPGTSFEDLIDLVRQTGFGQTALLDSKPAWTAMERVYQELLQDGPLIDFFWSWRFLAPKSPSHREHPTA